MAKVNISKIEGEGGYPPVRDWDWQRVTNPVRRTSHLMEQLSIERFGGTYAKNNLLTPGSILTANFAAGFGVGTVSGFGSRHNARGNPRHNGRHYARTDSGKLHFSDV
jgi:hypothetical protein